MTSPALLTGPSDHLLELEVVQYEFPDNRSNDYDANWLMIRMTAAMGSTGGPSMTRFS